MTVTVVIPTWNRRELLLRAVRTVLVQSHAQWNLLIVDDASTDGTAEAISALGDKRIRILVNEQRRGGGYCRARGALEAEGDFIAFLDSDDYWLPQKLERQVLAAVSSGRKRVVVFGPMMVSLGGEPIDVLHRPYRSGERIADFVYSGAGCAVQSSGLLISSDIGKEIRFDPGLYVNQDTDYMLRLERASARFVYLDEALHVQDTVPRTDRISTNPALVADSLAWFKRVSTDWSLQARRGFYLNDAAIRVARTGDRMRALRYFLFGMTWSTEIYYLLRQFLRIMGRGEVPKFLGSGRKLFGRVGSRTTP